MKYDIVQSISGDYMGPLGINVYNSDTIVTLLFSYYNLIVEYRTPYLNS